MDTEQELERFKAATEHCKTLIERTPTLRDRFALAALSGRGANHGHPPDETAKICFDYADAMLKHRDIQTSTGPCSTLPAWQEHQLHKKDWKYLRREKYGPCIGETHAGERISWWDSDVDFIACINAHFEDAGMIEKHKLRQEIFWQEKLGVKNTPENIKKVYHNIVCGTPDPFNV